MPNGVDTDEFTPGDDSEVQLYWPQLKNRRVVLFMSRLSPEKGLDILIPLWAELMQSGRYKNAMLVIAGPDDRGYVKVIQSMIDKYGINSSVLLPGMVREQKKLTILRRADIFILPSYSENFGNVVVEALSCGTPVITTTGTPWKQLQEFDAGRCVSPTSPELSQALRELLDMSKAELSAMGKRGRDFINKYYTWDIAVRRISTVFSCVATGKDVPLQPGQL
jgi:glycosyltransferase involved in cell wall biosynthesis